MWIIKQSISQINISYMIKLFIHVNIHAWSYWQSRIIMVKFGGTIGGRSWSTFSNNTIYNIKISKYWLLKIQNKDYLLKRSDFTDNCMPSKLTGVQIPWRSPCIYSPLLGVSLSEIRMVLRQHKNNNNNFRHCWSSI